MKLSIVIPVYNEVKTFTQLLEKVEAVDLGDIEKEIIIVDDYSTDGTRDLLKDVKYKVIFQEKNGGKGRAVRSGFEHITGDIVIIQDADLEYNPEDYKELLKPILDGRAKVVYGSRLLDDKIKKMEKEGWKSSHYLGNIILSKLTSFIYGTKITDMETCYKVMKKEVLDSFKLKAQRFDLEPEITAKVLKKGHRIVEIPIEYDGRDFKEGKKINWRDGVKAVYYLLKYRFSN